MKISRILHAGYVFEYQGVRLAFDPLFENPFSKNCYAFPAVDFHVEMIPEFSAVFISHFHDDHCSLESLNFLPKNTLIYIFCVHEELLQMIRALGFSKVEFLDLEIPVEIGHIIVIPHRALDADVDCLFEVRAADLRVLNVVDSWIDPAMMEKLSKTSWDLILWPFQTMREIEVIAPRSAKISDEKIPQEHQDQLRILKPKIVVPSSCQFRQESWSWYNYAFFPISYRGFAAQVNEILPLTKVQRLDPGQSMELSTNSVELVAPLNWISINDHEVVDYQYLPNLEIPSALQVSENLPAVNDVQKNFIEEFLTLGIGEKFLQHSPWDSEYFEFPKKWLLKVYDRGNGELCKKFEVDNVLLKPSTFTETEAEWVTEISAYKLYSALTAGETLTSLYLRINDRDFPIRFANEVRNADLGEDPLIRVLFTNNLLAYQRAQLDRILRSSPETA